MLVLTRRIGESIHLGDDIRVTVLAKLREQIEIGIVAPDGTVVELEGVRALPSLRNDGLCGYALSVLSGEHVRIGEATVLVGAQPRRASIEREPSRHVRLAVVAPKHLKVHREEVYRRIRAEIRETARNAIHADAVAAAPQRASRALSPARALGG
jgi:carbon storage regulator CsrA